MRRDFIGIGVSRAGTTWTWDKLTKHPEICPTPVKETFILTQYDEQVKRDNRLLRFGREHCKNKLMGEYTSFYLYRRRALGYARRFHPDAKIILTLRNPVHRLQTIYKIAEWKEHGKTQTPFGEWLLNEKSSVGPVKLNSYHDYIPMWQRAFGENLKVFLFDDLVADPGAFIRSVYEHVGVDPSFVPEGVNERMQSLNGRRLEGYEDYFKANPFSLPPEDLHALKEKFRDSVAKTGDLIGRDLSHWLS